DAGNVGKLAVGGRKKRLKATLPQHKVIAFSAHRKGNGKKFFAEAERRHLEGIMAKRADSPYASGSRTADWLKVKTARGQEVVIAGLPAPPHSAILRRADFGGARRRCMEIHRARRHRFQSRNPRGTLRDARKAEDGEVA